MDKKHRDTDKRVSQDSGAYESLMSDNPEIARYRHNSPFIVTPVIVTTQLPSMTVISFRHGKV